MDIVGKAKVRAPYGETVICQEFVYLDEIGFHSGLGRSVADVLDYLIKKTDSRGPLVLEVRLDMGIIRAFWDRPYDCARIEGVGDANAN